MSQGNSLCLVAFMRAGEILGDVDTLMIGDVIEQQYNASNYNMTASLSLVLMVILLVGLAVVNRYSDGDDEGGMMP